MPQFAMVVDESAMREQLRALRWPHYVYALCDEDGAGFYVGVGQGLRALAHVAEARGGDNSLKCRFIRHLGGRLRFALYFCTDWRPYAVALEAFLIREFRSDLVNVDVPSARLAAGFLDPRDETANSIRVLQSVRDKFEGLLRLCDADLDRINLVIANARAEVAA